MRRFVFQFFTLKVYGRHRKLLSEAQIYEQLCQIVAASQKNAPGVGILTTENRNVWGKAYKKLCKGMPQLVVQCVILIFCS